MEKLFTVVICIIAMCQLPLIANGKALKETATRPGNFTPVATIDGKTYFSQLEPLTGWEQARVHCIVNGMKMATVSTADQVAALRRSANLTDGAFWILARDALSESQFVWDDTEEPLGRDLGYLRGWSGGPLTCMTVIKINYPPLPAAFGLASYACDSHFGVLCEL